MTTLETQTALQELLRRCEEAQQERISSPDISESTAKLTGWVARDSEYDPYFGLGLVLFKEKPERTCDYWSGEIASQLPWELFPDLKLEDEPMEVEITIRRK